VQAMDANAPSTSRNDSRAIRRNFQLMTWTFSLNHATVTTLIMYASSVLGHSTGNLSNSLLFAVSLVASLGLAPVIASTFGPTRGLLIGLVGCSAYVLFFVLAAFLCTWETGQPGHPGGCGCDSSTPRSLVFVGAAFGGLGAGILWPSQGAFFSAAVARLAEPQPEEPGQVGGTMEESESEAAKCRLTSELSSSFAFALMVSECSTKLLLAVLLTYVRVEVWSSWVFLSALLLALLAVAVFATFAARMDTCPGNAARPICERTLTGLRLWGDPKLWLLSMTNFAFGFSVAWVNGVVNTRWHEATGDLHLLGYAGALTTGVAGVISKLSVGPVACGKGYVLALGSLCFLTIGLLSKTREPTDSFGWSVWLLLIHVLHGVGRGVYEGTNKGIFGDFFGDDRSVGAFSNVLVQVSASSIVGYSLASTSWKDAVYGLLMISASLMLPLYVLAGRLRCPRTVSYKDSEKDLERAPSD